MKTKSLILVAVLLLAVASLPAQQFAPAPPRPSAPPAASQAPAVRPAPPAPPAPPADPFGGALFPPELIMQNQRAIGLDTEQRDAIRGHIRTIQPQFTELQWEMQDAAEAMRSLLEEPQVDEEEVLGQLNHILDVERRVKRLQFQLMIRIKNTLTAEQQQQLRAIRKGGR